MSTVVEETVNSNGSPFGIKITHSVYCFYQEVILYMNIGINVITVP